MSLSGKDLVLSRFDGRIEERVPVLPLFQSFFANKMAGIKTYDARRCPHKVAMAQIELMEACRFDGIDTGVDGLAPIEACGSGVIFPTFGLPYTRFPAITDAEKLDMMDIPDPINDMRLQPSLTAAEEMVKEIGNDGFTQASLCGPITIAGELMGLGRFIEAIGRDDETIGKLLTFTVEVFKRYIDEYFRLDVDAFAFAEPVCSADYLSDNDFEKYALPGIVDCIDHMKRSGKMSVIHMCGGSERMIEHVAGTAIDGICTELDVSKLPERVHEKTVIGTISYEHLASRNGHRVMKEALRCIDSMNNCKHILASGDIIPMTTDIHSLKMLRYASEYHVLNER